MVVCSRLLDSYILVDAIRIRSNPRIHQTLNLQPRLYHDQHLHDTVMKKTRSWEFYL